MKRPLNVLVAALALAVAPACGSSPSAPTPSEMSLTGSWSGTWQFVTAGVTVTDTVTADLTQSGGTASGRWASASGTTGQLSVSVAPSSSGTMTLSLALVTQCTTAPIPVIGTESSTRLDFTLGAIPSSGTCQWPANNHFVLTKQ